MVGVSVDAPEQNAALVESLRLPFPVLSDPDRSLAVEPFGVADPNDERNIARPAMILVAPGGDEVFRFESRDFADRLAEDAIIAELRNLELSPTTQDLPRRGTPVPGRTAMRFDQLYTYFRGARFAAVAMTRRRPEIEDEADVFVEQMDRYLENVKRLFKDKRSG